VLLLPLPKRRHWCRKRLSPLRLRRLPPLQKR
jgi:hypothetical protein